MKAKKIAASAEEMKQKLFRSTSEAGEESAGIADRFAVYREHIGKTVTIPVEHITIEENVRKEVDQSSPKFQELVDSIRRDGLLQNLIIEVREGARGVYLSCVSGQRRLLAARAAGVEKAVCLLKRYTAAERLSAGLTENLVRQDLTCIDIAEGYAALRNEGWTEEEISARFERGQRTIRRYLVIASWPEEIKQTMRRYPDVFTTRVIFHHFVAHEFPTEADLRAAVEARLSTALTPGVEKLNAGAKRPSAEIKSIASSLSERLRLPVSVKGTQEKGTISISYLSPEERERIVQLLQQNAE